MTSGPTIGILLKNLERNGLAPLNAGAITPAALPNIFAANPPTFAKPLLANPSLFEIILLYLFLHQALRIFSIL